MRRDKYSNRQLSTNWYDCQSLIDRYPNAKFYMIYGERKNGKTYSAKKVILQCINEGRSFMYVRRTHKMITRRKASKLFDDMQDYCVDNYGGKVIFNYANHSFELAVDDENPTTIGYVTSIEDAFEDKGIPFNSVKYILFDEFIDYWYMHSEIELFLHTLANVIRDEERQGVKVIMLGNTIDQTCPYFDYFGINPRKIKQGHQYYFVNPKGGRIAVEYTKTRVSCDAKEQGSPYFGFGSVESDMILSGTWEAQSCETKSIDELRWSSKRRLIPLYITGQGHCFELSYTNTKFPALFIRCPNIQNCVVSKSIKFNLAFDGMKLFTANGDIVPSFKSKSKWLGEGVLTELDIVNECLLAGRCVFENEYVGTVFQKMWKVIYN